MNLQFFLLETPILAHFGTRKSLVHHLQDMQLAPRPGLSHLAGPTSTVPTVAASAPASGAPGAHRWAPAAVAAALAARCAARGRCSRSCRRAEGEQVVTPWEVEAGDDGVDYVPWKMQDRRFWGSENRWKIDDFGRPEAMGNVWKLDETGKFAGHEGDGCCGSSQGLNGEMLRPKVKTNQYLDGALSVTVFGWVVQCIVHIWK